MTEAYVENNFDIVISNKRCYKVGWIQSDLDGLNALQASFFWLIGHEEVWIGKGKKQGTKGGDRQ